MIEFLENQDLLRTGIMILDSKMGAFSTKYIIKTTVGKWLVTAGEAHIVESKFQNGKSVIYHILGFQNLVLTESL